MSIQRWEPFRDMLSLSEAMDRLIEESFIRPSGGIAGIATMPMDIRETADAFVVEACIPGVHRHW